ncbi:PREDICTED: protein wntless homolog [Priapulus caudatus]|uniref:Protein wntless homolog n=1 Tax=Priapulus caudatus TaxID=37621 RepID=A0ABM1EIU3_PRICU|nr:PREDICTED: protein wntless homolog [Priapulus caudatus]
MSGTVLENLSNRKLGVLTVSLLLAQMVFFLIGGLIAPAPNNVQVLLATKCVDEGSSALTQQRKWFYPRGEGNCNRVSTLDDPYIIDNHITADHIVFSLQFPNPMEGTREPDMVRWFQYMVGVMMLDIAYQKHNPMIEKPLLGLDLRLGYRDIGDKPGDWKELAHASETRTMDCSLDEQFKEDGYNYNCSMLPLYEYGAVHHNFYLINIRLPITGVTDNKNYGIGTLKDIWVIVIHQNGGFTKVWYSTKTVVTPILIGIIIWFWRRVKQLPRPPVLLEKMLLGLGVVLVINNIPIEWLTLWMELPFMLLLSDIKQGVFFSLLLCFWIIFAGEHLMDDVERNRLVAYWKHLAAVMFGCLCMFIFDMCERGVQLRNPFYSIWATDLGTNLAYSFIIIAGICACLYFILLCWMVFKVFRNITFKRGSLPSMPSKRRAYYEGIIYRFKFLMLITLLCAALTVIFFIVSQVAEGHWKWGEDLSEERSKLEYTSAFYVGAYGMWNVYVFALLCLYAPSHKYGAPALIVDGDGEGEEIATNEEIEFSRLPSEVSQLTAFVKKTAAD